MILTLEPKPKKKFPKMKTRVKDKCLNPVWNESFVVDVSTVEAGFGRLSSRFRFEIDNVGFWTCNESLFLGFFSDWVKLIQDFKFQCFITLYLRSLDTRLTNPG